MVRCFALDEGRFVFPSFLPFNMSLMFSFNTPGMPLFGTLSRFSFKARGLLLYPLLIFPLRALRRFSFNGIPVFSMFGSGLLLPVTIPPAIPVRKRSVWGEHGCTGK
jgi:hypothetical protein